MRSEELCCLRRVRFLIIFSVTGESSNPGHRRASGAHEGRVFPSRRGGPAKGSQAYPSKRQKRDQIACINFLPYSPHPCLHLVTCTRHTRSHIPTPIQKYTYTNSYTRLFFFFLFLFFLPFSGTVLFRARCTSVYQRSLIWFVAFFNVVGAAKEERSYRKLIISVVKGDKISLLIPQSVLCCLLWGCPSPWKSAEPATTRKCGDS